MPNTTIETLRPVYEAIGRKDWDAIFRDAHPDFHLKTPEVDPTAGTHHGRKEAARAFEDFFEPFDEVAAEPQEVFENGDRVVVFFTLRSRPKGSSSVVEIRAAHLWTLRDGKAARLEIFPRRQQALEAAGLSKKTPS